MDFQSFIKPELLILIPVLYFIGAALKKSDGIRDKTIPIALGCVSVFLCALWVLSTGELVTAQDYMTAAFTAIVQGVLVAGASVYANQLYVQGKKEE